MDTSRNDDRFEAEDFSILCWLGKRSRPSQALNFQISPRNGLPTSSVLTDKERVVVIAADFPWRYDARWHMVRVKDTYTPTFPIGTPFSLIWSRYTKRLLVIPFPFLLSLHYHGPSVAFLIIEIDDLSNLTHNHFFSLGPPETKWPPPRSHMVFLSPTLRRQQKEENQYKVDRANKTLGSWIIYRIIFPQQEGGSTKSINVIVCCSYCCHCHFHHCLLACFLIDFHYTKTPSFCAPTHTTRVAWKTHHMCILGGATAAIHPPPCRSWRKKPFRTGG